MEIMLKIGLTEKQVEALAALGVADVPALYELCVNCAEGLAKYLEIAPEEPAAIAEKCVPELPPGYLESRKPMPPLGVIPPGEVKNDVVEKE